MTRDKVILRQRKKSNKHS